MTDQQQQQQTHTHQKRRRKRSTTKRKRKTATKQQQQQQQQLQKKEKRKNRTTKQQQEQKTSQFDCFHTSLKAFTFNLVFVYVHVFISYVGSIKLTFRSQFIAKVFKETEKDERVFVL